ncbi:M23 family metallopeptidase [Halobacteria archaeon AArc-m2/3/4]|uniref:M23 family metallopeptidase n=1 Tax=Natronoglomus mannanivorans TaxID=2979990 RepID=A0AAP2Z2R4_9EURY|nr:M23 family metallopeptidase [Halobacteria archaeon AArc-xg1-1]MCU4972913.1 M23 family metallopeptidase [Halobacteria archaeon AArc-m2/3/4]
MDRITHPLGSDPSSRGSRLTRIGRRLPSPAYLWFLGLLSVPSMFFGRLESLEGFVLFFLFGLWPIVAGLVSGIRSETDADTVDPIEWIDIGDGATNVRASVGTILTMFQPIVAVTGLLQFAGHVPIGLRYRGRLPGPGCDESTVDYRLPIEGQWTVVNGSPDRRYSHSWSILTQRYAYDLVITDADGRTHEGERTGPDAHYCFDEPILAPADGTVVATRNDHRDYHRTDGWLDPLQRDLRGNYVTIEHADGEYSVLAHLKRGSVTVTEGDRVERGEEIGRCGNSGNSTEPHLHFHVQDHPNFFLGMGLPVQFADVVTEIPGSEPVGHDRSYIHAGQLVSNRSSETDERPD